MTSENGILFPPFLWWKYIFTFVINTSIVNSFILYKETNSPSRTKHGATQKLFPLALYKQIMGNFSSRKVIGRKRSYTNAAGGLPHTH